MNFESHIINFENEFALYILEIFDFFDFFGIKSEISQTQSSTARIPSKDPSFRKSDNWAKKD